MVTRPGSGFFGSMPNASSFTHCSMRRSSSGVGRGFLSGGMSPARRFLRTFCHRSSLPTSSPGDLNVSKETSPFAAPSAWQSQQYFLSNGSTSLR